MSAPRRKATGSRVLAAVVATFPALLCWQYPRGALYGVRAPVVDSGNPLIPGELRAAAPSYTSPERAAVPAALSALLALVFLYFAFRPDSGR